MQKVVSNIFGKATKVLPSSHMLYVARQEGLRKWLKVISRRCKTSGQCLWTLINNANEAGRKILYNI
jgi:hypothetical protein